MNQLVIHEVGLRDGLQMEQETVPLEQKISWIEALVAARVDILQIGSFVHPGKVPQMADTDKLCSHFSQVGRKPGSITFSALVLNEKGLERGLRCGIDLFCMGVSASETHSRKNTGMPVAEALERIVAMAQQALIACKGVQVSVQSAFGCGYEGRVPDEKVLQIVERYLEKGLKNISLADTAGHATPDRVARMFERIFRMDPGVECTCHFHNTYGLGIANCIAAMNAGVRNFESSVAGLGGCPFTKVAGGNVCTEDFVHFLQCIGLRRDIDLGKLIETARSMSAYFGREMPGMVYKAGSIAAINIA